jgi:3-deoxy-7-phosphoheptulonate synthase
MTPRIDDLRITDLQTLDPPRCVMAAHPASDRAVQTVSSSRKALQNILKKADNRLAVIIGPCSIHDVDAAQQYAARLRQERERLSDDLEIVMRVYFEKPRTALGWKGLINDPHLNGDFAINEGLAVARNLLCVINDSGLPTGSEFLDVITPQYIADLASWGAIGARTVESQIHREMTSGLSCPIGFKNSTNGDVKVAVDAMTAASHPHHFLAVTKDGSAAIATTTGNHDCHIVLRGGAAPNYGPKDINQASALLEKAGFYAAIMVDVSHANSGKNPDNQPRVAAELGEQIAAGEDRIIGVMIESHLVAGRQDLVPGKPLTYGQSITDGCIDWATSVQVLEGLARASRARRKTLAGIAA